MLIQDVKKLDTTIWSPVSAWIQYLSILQAVRFDHEIADFLIWDTNHWTITKVELGYGSATAVLQNIAGGVLLVTNAAADNDSYQAQFNGEPFKLLTGKFCYCEAKFRTADPTQVDLLFGLAITDTTLIAGFSDGVVWRKDDGDAYLDCQAVKNTTATTKAAVGTLAADTWTRVGFYFDGYGHITPFLNGVEYASLEISTNIPDDEELTPSFAIMNGEAAAKSVYIDYLMAVQAR